MKNGNGKHVSFFQRVINGLLANKTITFNLADIPKSYRSQPFNLGAKLKDRAQLDVEVVLSPDKIRIYLNHSQQTKQQITTATAIC